MAFVNSQSSDTDGTCTVCYQDKVTKKSYQDIATLLHKETILQEFNSLSDAWKMFQGISVFRKYLGAKIVFEIETPPKPCTMCLVKIINLMEACYVMTRTYESGAKAKSGHSTFENTSEFQIDTTKSRRQIEETKGNREVLVSSQTIKRPIGVQPTVNQNTPANNVPSPPSSPTPKPAQHLKSPLSAKKRDCSAEKETLQQEKRPKIVLPQKIQQKGPKSETKQATLGGNRSDTIITDQRSPAVPSSTEISKSSALEEFPKRKELRSTYLNLLEKTMSSKGLNQHMGSAEDVELQVYNNTKNEDEYVIKMNKLLDFCNNAKTELSYKDDEKAICKNNIKEQNEVKEGAVDERNVKLNNVIEVAKGKRGSLETSKNMADLTSVDKKSSSGGSLKEKVLCTICGKQFSQHAFKTHMKICTGSIKSSPGVKKKSRSQTKKKIRKLNIDPSKTVLAKKLKSDSEGFCADSPADGKCE